MSSTKLTIYLGVCYHPFNSIHNHLRITMDNNPRNVLAYSHENCFTNRFTFRNKNATISESSFNRCYDIRVLSFIM